MLGYNTDYKAAMDCLENALGGAVPPGTPSPLQDKKVLVLGAGGVARAVMYGLQRRGAKTTIASRTRSRAQFLADTFGGKCVEWQARHAPTEIIVNCTPVGMHPNVDESPFNKSHLKPTMIVFDTVYNPESTLLLEGSPLARLPDRDGRRDVHPAGGSCSSSVHRQGSAGGADARNAQAGDRAGEVLSRGWGLGIGS